jgi:hypothetical protein
MEVASVHPGSPGLADQAQTGGWAGRFQPTRPVWTMAGVVLDIHPEDLLHVTTAEEQPPVQALGADGTDPPLRGGVRVRRLDRRDAHLGALGAEHVVEPATERRVPVADNNAHPPAALAQHQGEVAGLLGDPAAVGVGGHPAQVHPASPCSIQHST